MSMENPNITISLGQRRSPSPERQVYSSPPLRNRVQALRLQHISADSSPLLGLLMKDIREDDTESALKRIGPSSAQFLDRMDSSGTTPLVEASARGQVDI